MERKSSWVWVEVFGTGICLWLRVVSTNPRLGVSKENIFQVRVSAYVYAGLRFDEAAERDRERDGERQRRLGEWGTQTICQLGKQFSLLAIISLLFSAQVKQLFWPLSFPLPIAEPPCKQIKLIWFVGPQKPLPKCPSSSSSYLDCPTAVRSNTNTRHTV